MENLILCAAVSPDILQSWLHNTGEILAIPRNLKMSFTRRLKTKEITDGKQRFWLNLNIHLVSLRQRSN